MRVLVTGGSGFTGRRVVTRMVAAKHEVLALARSRDAGTRLLQLGAMPVFGDLDDARSVDEALVAANADALVSMASLGFGHAPSIVAAALENGIGRAVFVSTTAIFTRLTAPSKPVRIEAERVISTSGLAWTIVRPTMIYGAPGDRNMSRLLAGLRRTPVFPLPGGGRQLHQPVHVDDLAATIVACLGASASVGCAYDVAGPEALSFRQVVAQAAAAVRRSPLLLPIPLGPMIAGLRLYDRMSRAPRFKAEQFQRLQEDKAFDIRPARTDLGHDPRSFDDGIRAEAALLA